MFLHTNHIWKGYDIKWVFYAYKQSKLIWDSFGSGLWVFRSAYELAKTNVCKTHGITRHLHNNDVEIQWKQLKTSEREKIYRFHVNDLCLKKCFYIMRVDIPLHLCHKICELHCLKPSLQMHDTRMTRMKTKEFMWFARTLFYSKIHVYIHFDTSNTIEINYCLRLIAVLALRYLHVQVNWLGTLLWMGEEKTARAQKQQQHKNNK